MALALASLTTFAACSGSSDSGPADGDAGGGSDGGATGDGAGGGGDGGAGGEGGGASAVVLSTFDSSADGWTLSNSGVDLLFEPTGGNPGGGVTAELLTSTDPVSTVYFIAPATFHGDRSALYGGRLHFDFGAPSFKDDFGAPIVVLFGGSSAISWSDPPTMKSAGWLGVDVPLSAGHWNLYDTSVGAALAKDASESDVRGVLANVTDVRIFASDFDGASDKVDLDNVGLYAP